MPGPPGNRPGSTQARRLVQGQSDPNAAVPNGGDVRPSQAIRAWHSLTVTLAKTMPESLIRAGQYQHGTLLALRGRGRVR